MNKKIVLSFAIVLFVFCNIWILNEFAGIKVSAEGVTSGTCGDNLTWEYDESTYTLIISGFGEMDDYGSTSAPWKSKSGTMETIVISNNVKSIGAYAFDDCYGLTRITIGEGVTSIGSYAFRGCTELTDIYYNAVNADDLTSTSRAFYNSGPAGDGVNVVFGESVEKIPSVLFHGTRLKSVTIGNSVTSIGGSAFSECTRLTSITIPDSVTKIGDGAFENCRGLTTITIGNSVTSIGRSAFSGCTGLTEINYNAVNIADLSYSSNVFRNAGTSGDGINVIFGNCVEKIPSHLFYVDYSSSRPNIKSVIFSNSVTSIGGSAFSSCTGLTSLIIPDSVTSIGGSTFSGCTGLTSITIPDSVTSIGDYAFSNCNLLTSITIGKDVTSIGSYAFRGCTGLTDIYYNAVNVADFSSSSRTLYNAGITREIHNTDHDIKVWQTGFYDHIIRDIPDYENIWTYIDENPIKWDSDEYY